MSINSSSPRVPPFDSPAPGWRVVSLIDPVGAGQDLAFTQGLAALHLPELLLWARPTEGFDPGVDWLLSHRERSRLLSSWAMEMVAGRLGPGAEREEGFDGGGATVVFRFGPLTSAESLHQLQLPGQTKVLSVSWSLIRRVVAGPDRQQRAPSVALERRMQGWIAKAEATTAAWRSRLDAPPGASPDDPGGGAGASTLSIAVPGGHRFGPMTPWVDARIAQLLAADADVIGAFLGRLRLAELARSDERLLEELSRLACRSGRSPACREASRAAQEVSLTMVGWPERATTVWQQAVGLTLGSATPQQADVDRLTVALTDGVEVLLLIAVLADVAPSSMIASASGPWEWAVAQERLPGRQWLAPPHVRDATRAVLAAATPAQFVAAADRAQGPFGLAERHDLTALLRGLQTTAAASSHQGSLFRRDQCRGLPESIVRAADALAAQLLTAMALPDRLPPGGWDLVRDTVYPLAPELPTHPDQPDPSP